MSKEDKHLHMKSATEIKQAPLDISTQNGGKIKKSKSPPKSKHKHDYQLYKITSFLEDYVKNTLFEHSSAEYFVLHYKCSIIGCNREKQEYKGISIEEWNDKYKEIYDKLHKESK